MVAKLLECDALFVVIGSKSSWLATIIIKMIDLITILHGKYIHNWFANETNEITFAMIHDHIEWNKIDIGIWILCFSSLKWLLDIIGLALMNNN